MVLAERELERREAPVIRSAGLVAAYSVGQTLTGEWFAIGTVRNTSENRHHPAWLIVSTGSTVEATVAALQEQLDGEARQQIER